MSVLEMFDLINQNKGQREEKLSDVTLIDAQLRFVREVDGSIEHVTWFIDVDRLMDFIYTLKQTE